MDAKDAEAAEHDRYGNIPADRASEAKIQGGKDGKDRASQREDFFVVHKSNVDLTIADISTPHFVATKAAYLDGSFPSEVGA